MDVSYGTYGSSYSGSSGPQGVVANRGDVIEFTTDGSVTTSGFRVCQAGEHPAVSFADWIQVHLSTNELADFSAIQLRQLCII